MFLVLLFTAMQYTLPAQQHDAEIVDFITEITFANNCIHKQVSIKIRVNNRSGDIYSKISIPFNGNNNLSNLEASLIDNLGNVVRKLKKSDIIEKSAIEDAAFYEDSYVKEFTLRHNSYPYYIEYSYGSTVDQYLFVASWTPVINYRIPTLDASLTVNIPSDLEVRIKSKNTQFFPGETGKRQTTMVWNASYDDPIESEIFSPPDDELIPSVLVVPERFFFAIKGSQSDWIELGNWQSNILDSRRDLPESEKRIVNSLVGDLTGDREKIRKLYHYLQDNTRYINISLETGGLVPYPASYVSSHKYGDCKALTNYFMALLEYAGMRSYYTKVYAGDNPIITDTAFVCQQFNHIILFIPLASDTIWLDCTSKGPFGYLGSFTQGRHALVVERDNSRIISTPELAPDDVCETKTITINRIDGNIAYAELKNRYMGDSFDNLFYLSRNFNPATQRDILNKYIIPGKFEMTDYEIIPAKRDDRFISLRANVKINNLYRKFGNEYIAFNIPLGIPPFTSPDSRKSDIVINYPIHLADTISYPVPEGYTLTSLQLTRDIESEMGRFKSETLLSDGQVMIIKEFLLYRGSYPLKKYNELYSFISEVKEAEASSSLVFTKN